MIVTIDRYGREILLTVADEPDNFGQFEVALAVDGKDRYKAAYTDRTEIPGSRCVEHNQDDCPLCQT